MVGNKKRDQIDDDINRVRTLFVRAMQLLCDLAIQSNEKYPHAARSCALVCMYESIIITFCGINGWEIDCRNAISLCPIHTHANTHTVYLSYSVQTLEAPQVAY